MKVVDLQAMQNRLDQMTKMDLVQIKALNQAKDNPLTIILVDRQEERGFLMMKNHLIQETMTKV